MRADTKCSSPVDEPIREEAEQGEDDKDESQRRHDGTSIVGPAGHGSTGARCGVGDFDNGVPDDHCGGKDVAIKNGTFSPVQETDTPACRVNKV